MASPKEKNFGDFHYFLYTASNPSYSFRNYTDQETGMETGYIIGYDSKKGNEPIYKNWMFNRDSQRQIRVSKNEKDHDGKSALEFLRNSPECKGSPNGRYAGEGDSKTQYMVYFKELNDTADAKSATDTRKKVVAAQSKAFELKGQDLIDMCILIGVSGVAEEIMVHRISDYASNYPEKFIALLEDPSRKLRSFIRRAINAKVLVQTGKMITWEGTTIGADEDDAVSNLTKDTKLKQAIEVNLNKFS